MKLDLINQSACIAEFNEIGQEEGSLGAWIWLHPLAGGANRGFASAGCEDARGPGRLPLLGTRLQHAEGACTALRRRFHGEVEGVDELEDFRLDFDDIGDLRLHLQLLLLLNGVQLARKVVWLERVDDREEEFAVTGWLSVEALVREVAEDVLPLVAVVHDASVGELLVARYFHLAERVVLEVTLAAVEQGSDELHGAVAPLRQEDLACVHERRNEREKVRAYL